jgi:hypothetical protein
MALEVLLRYAVIGVTVASLWRLFRSPAAGRQPYLFAALNLAVVAGLVIGIYDVEPAVWRDYRVLGPHLLLSLLVLLSAGAYRVVLAVAAANVLFAPAFVSQFADFHRDRVRADRAFIAAVREQVRGNLKYDPAAPAWSNTVLIPMPLLCYPLLGIPSGIGVSCLEPRAAQPQLPLKSRYVLVDDGRVWYFRDCHLRPIARTSLGRLYLNLDSLSDPQPGPDGR